MTDDVITVHWVSLTAGWGFIANYEGCFSQGWKMQSQQNSWLQSERATVRTHSLRQGFLFPGGRGGQGGKVDYEYKKKFALHSEAHKNKIFNFKTTKTSI